MAKYVDKKYEYKKSNHINYYDDGCYQETNRYELDNPENLELPFLAYGVFNPHQLAYSQIKRHVYETEPLKINYELSNINGMPVLLNTKCSYDVDAYIIKFNHYKQEKAYNTIRFSKDMHIYSWKVINVNDQDVNVLMCADDKDFSKMPTRHYNLSCYDWREDNIFKNIIEYLEFNIEGFKTHPFEYRYDNLKLLIAIQSSYMTLWSAIDRFLTFRYGNSQTTNIKKLSRELFFEESLKKNYNTINRGFYGRTPYWTKEIFSAQHLSNYTLDPKYPVCSAFYYYTLRNNVVHSGKVMHEEIDTVWNALVGLTEIFKDILEAVKEE